MGALGSSTTTTHPLLKPPHRRGGLCYSGGSGLVLMQVAHPLLALLVMASPLSSFVSTSTRLAAVMQPAPLTPRPRIKRYFLCKFGRNVRLFFLIICRRFCRGMHSPSPVPPATAARPSRSRCQVKPSPPRGSPRPNMPCDSSLSAVQATRCSISTPLFPSTRFREAHCAGHALPVSTLTSLSVISALSALAPPATASWLGE